MARGGRGETDRNRVGSRNRKNNYSEESKRLILIVSCILLVIVCILLLFQTCNGEKKQSPGTEEQGKKQLVSTQFFIYNNVTQNAVTCPSHYNLEYQTSNSITATATDILNLIVLNANRVYGDDMWAVGNTPSISEKRNFINYNFTCYEALLALVEQWNLQWNLAIDQTTGKYIINIYPKQAPRPDSGGNLTQSIGDNPGSMILSIVGLVILLAAYITARVKSNGGDLVITANVFDKILILLSPTLFSIAALIGFAHELSEAQIVLLSLSGLMLQGSIIFSAIANKGNWLNITLSILAKLFIFVITIFLIYLILAILILSILLSIMSHSSHEGTYIVKYDHFLDQWVGYRVD